VSIIKEFREFAMRGNVIDLAVAVVIGGAFNKIVTSLVENMIMPPVNLITAKFGVNFKEWAIKQTFVLPKKDAAGNEILDAAGLPVMEAVNYTVLNIGPFIQTVVDFTLLAVSVFLVIKTMNTLKRRFDRVQVAPAAKTEVV